MTTTGVLYTKDILRWAASLPTKDRLAEPHGTAERRSPSCGSVVRADVTMADGRVDEAAFSVQTCALGQASAAMLLKRAVGLSREELVSARMALENALKCGAEWPAYWEELALLKRARDYPGRHAALLIGYDALLGAVDTAIAEAKIVRENGTSGTNHGDVANGATDGRA